MKFTDYLLMEAPLVADHIKNDSSHVEAEYTKDSKKDSYKKSEFEWNGYTVHNFESDDGATNTAYIIDKDGNKRIQVGYMVFEDINDILCYFAKFIQVGEKRLDSKTMVEFIFHLAKKNKVEYIKSDFMHSKGGESLWKNILKYATDKSFKVGVYDDSTEEFEMNDGDFNKWYETTKKDIYGKTKYHADKAFVVKLK